MHPSPPARFRELPVSTVAGKPVPVATTRRSRLLGLALMDRDRCAGGLLIPGCRSVHTFGMRFELRLIFLDAAGRKVLEVDPVAPRRVVGCRAADSVLELPSEIGTRQGGETCPARDS